VKRLFYILFFVIASSVFSPLSASTAAEHRVGSELKNATNKEAVLTNTRDSYRVCNSRPQRLLTSVGSHVRQYGKISFQSKFHLLKSYLSDDKSRAETAPFSSSASCAYYVFALRRLRC